MTTEAEALRAAQAPKSETVPEALGMARLLERGGYTGAATMMREQHAEIERLRGALRGIAANTCCNPCQEAALAAKAALRDAR